nr:hypothetical protein CFP56_11031 [Quercus suber]
MGMTSRAATPAYRTVQYYRACSYGARKTFNRATIATFIVMSGDSWRGTRRCPPSALGRSGCTLQARWRGSGHGARPEAAPGRAKNNDGWMDEPCAPCGRATPGQRGSMEAWKRGDGSLRHDGSWLPGAPMTTVDHPTPKSWAVTNDRALGFVTAGDRE